MRPEGTLRTDFAIRIINALFVRAAEDPFCYGNRLNPVQGEELEYLVADLYILSNIALVTKQPRHFGLGAFGANDSDGYLAGSCVVRTVERDRGYRITAETAACFLG
jgi:hypothetical protein